MRTWIRLCLLIIAATPAARAQVEWSVTAKPILDIPGLDAAGKEVFLNPGGATRLSNGSVLVADRGSTSIRLFDASGRPVSNVGRAGRGPGEYPLIISATRCGRDSMLVWARDMAVMVGASGAAARQFKIPSDSARPSPLMNFVCSSGGTISFLSDPNGRKPGATPEMMIMLASIGSVDRAGRMLSHIDSIPAGEWMRAGRGAFPRPLGPTTSIAMVADRLVIGVSDSARLWVQQANGTRSPIRIPSTPRAPTAEEFANAVEAVAGMAPVTMRPTAAAELAKAPVPARLPPYFGLFGDSEGLLWVQTSVPGAAQTQLVSMRLDGQVVSRISIPLKFTVYEIGRDYILGIYDDASDEQHIAVLTLGRK